MVALSYTTVDRVLGTTSLIGSASDISSGQICDIFAYAAESIIDAKLADLYVVPISPAPAILVTIATDLTIYRILVDRIFTPEQLKKSEWVDRFKESMELLDAIADGTIKMPAGSGSVVATPAAPMAQSNNSKYQQTFQEDLEYDQIRDPQKIQDIEDSRDTGTNISIPGPLDF